MNIGIIGYGKMGKEIEQIAISRNHKITLIADKDDTEKLKKIDKTKVDVVIEFTNAQSAINNYNYCFERNIPVVSGTTGITNEDYKKITEKVKKENKTFMWASNFSVGVNITFKINEILAKLINPYKNYTAQIEEIHHIHKLDSPSGTAISLANGIIENIDHLSAWKNNSDINNNELEIHSIRKDEVPGTHIVEYKSEIDKITIKHEAFNRKGFAIGAVLSAEFIFNKIGVFTFDDLLKN
jgi:4-hydroxy-tetrahydrodipicolinate reductase